MGKNENLAEDFKIFLKEMVTQLIPYDGYKYFDSFLITGSICLSEACREMTSTLTSGTTEL